MAYIKNIYSTPIKPVYLGTAMLSSKLDDEVVNKQLEHLRITLVTDSVPLYNCFLENHFSDASVLRNGQFLISFDMRTMKNIVLPKEVSKKSLIPKNYHFIIGED